MLTVKVDANTFPVAQNQKNYQKLKVLMTPKLLGGIPKCFKVRSAHVDNPIASGTTPQKLKTQPTNLVALSTLLVLWYFESIPSVLFVKISADSLNLSDSLWLMIPHVAIPMSVLHPWRASPTCFITPAFVPVCSMRYFIPVRYKTHNIMGDWWGRHWWYTAAFTHKNEYNRRTDNPVRWRQQWK